MTDNPKRTSDQVRRDIASERDELRNAVFDLRSRIRRVVTRIAAKIAVVVAAALAIAAILGVLRLLRRWKR